MIHTIELCRPTLGKLYIASGFDLNLKAIKNKHDEIWNNKRRLSIKTSRNKIVHYSAIFNVDMSKFVSRLWVIHDQKCIV